jgi:hypothetical protein
MLCGTYRRAKRWDRRRNGTLTRNEMNVERMIVGLTAGIALAQDRMLLHSISVNSRAVVAPRDELGSQTECALVRFVTPEACDGYRSSADIVKCFQFDRTPSEAIFPDVGFRSLTGYRTGRSPSESMSNEISKGSRSHPTYQSRPRFFWDSKV